MYFLLYTEADVPLELSLGQILNFFSGSAYPPPMGFDAPASIHFNCTSEFPLATTCAIQLILPTKHYDNPGVFRERMIYAMTNHGGFGLH